MIAMAVQLKFNILTGQQDNMKILHFLSLNNVLINNPCITILQQEVIKIINSKSYHTCGRHLFYNYFRFLYS